VSFGWIGIWLLVIGAVAVIAELALMVLWTARLVRKSRRLSERLQADQARMQADVERLQAAIAETRALWQPYRRLLRWLRHPIAIALIQSYARRRVAPR
jgi:uncharacterized membrane protein YcjF (UPF0283 family)